MSQVLHSRLLRENPLMGQGTLKQFASPSAHQGLVSGFWSCISPVMICCVCVRFAGFRFGPTMTYWRVIQTKSLLATSTTNLMWDTEIQLCSAISNSTVSDFVSLLYGWYIRQTWLQLALLYWIYSDRQQEPETFCSSRASRCDTE